MVWCAFCARGEGCSGYDYKPPSCSAFKCEWLKGFGLEADRPDKTGVVLDFVLTETDLPGGLLQMFEAKQGSLESLRLREITAAVSLKGIFVGQWYLSGRKKMFAPSREVLTPAIREALEKEGCEISILHLVRAPAA